MITELLGVVVIVILAVFLSVPLGKYISKVFKGERTWSDFFKPLENFIFKLAGINPEEPMDWKQNMKAFLVSNVIFFIWAYVILVLQGIIPWWNPAGIANMEATLAFNTAASFVSNTNLQHYSGETGLTYTSLMIVICFLQFVSASAGVAVLALLFKAISQRRAADIGNYYNLFLKSSTRIFLPLAFVVAVLLVINGTPSHYEGAKTFITLNGDTSTVAQGPAAPIIAIKQIGTNGGGYYGTNSAHPLENPNYLTNIIELISIVLIPMALVVAFGYYLNRKRIAAVLFAVMAVFYITFVSSTINWELSGNSKISSLGINQSLGSMEGKELRFGAASSALWGVSTTSTSNGSVNSMHDSQTPLSGGIYLLDMMINSIFGGVGVGFINFFMFFIIAVFIAGLMVGRTPEMFGKKIEAKEVKIAALVILVHPFFILAGTAIASYLQSVNPNSGWLNNPSYHGFSEMLYEYTSAAANNGSEFGGLNGNLGFWNITTGSVMLLSRFLPIIGPIAIAGSLASKKHTPESEGSLKLDSFIFSVVLVGVLFVVAALSFFPALTLGPIAEFFSM